MPTPASVPEAVALPTTPPVEQQPAESAAAGPLAEWPPPGTLLPLAPPPTPAWRDPDDPPATVEFQGPRQQLDDDGFSDFSSARQATVLAGPLAPPGQAGRRMIRYDLLAGAALILALLALVPLLLLRGDPDEIASTPKVPAAGDTNGDVTVELAEPTDLADKVRLNWRATRELDFAVVVAAEGETARVLLADRSHTMTVDVEPGLKYCFLVQATDGDQVYESDPVALRGATCRQ